MFSLRNKKKFTLNYPQYPLLSGALISAHVFRHLTKQLSYFQRPRLGGFEENLSDVHKNSCYGLLTCQDRCSDDWHNIIMFYLLDTLSQIITNLLPLIYEFCFISMGLITGSLNSWQ